MSHSLTIQSVTPTVCELFRIAPPESNSSAAPRELLQKAASVPGGAALERLLIYAPDAIGCSFLARFPEIASKFDQSAPHRIELDSVFPPKTPVCFASMFSGATPSVHGIKRYERPVLTVDTLFDALTRAGKRVAIVAVKSCSIDIIFRNRPLDYFSEAYDPEVTARTLELLSEDRHDVILAYHQEYDDLLHKFGPYSLEAEQAANRHADACAVLYQAACKAWKNYRWALAVTPDHGGHEIPDEFRGDHGEDIPEDMEVAHFWRFESQNPILKT
jgi:predicted AlkP superfamily pyrophosphatase or phosphodiesterase